MPSSRALSARALRSRAPLTLCSQLEHVKNAGGAIPAAVMERGAFIEERVKGLSDLERMLCDAASVYDNDFDVGMLRPVVPGKVKSKLPVLLKAIAENSGILVATNLPDDAGGVVPEDVKNTMFTFDHDVTRAYLREKCDAKLRAKGHFRVAKWYTTEYAEDPRMWFARIGYHYEMSTKDNVNASCFFAKAAQYSLLFGDVHLCCLWLQRALALVPMAEQGPAGGERVGVTDVFAPAKKATRAALTKATAQLEVCRGGGPAAVADERMLKWLQDGIEELTADVKWYSNMNVVLASSTTEDEEAKA